MLSKWYELKPKAVELRKRGLSLKAIETRLSIPRSTLSGWLKDVVLSKSQKEKLLKNWKDGLIRARQKAVVWHNAQKNLRLEKARSEAQATLENLDLKNDSIVDLALAMLYWGEGRKGNAVTSLGNSDPLILRFFVAVLGRNYGIDARQIKGELHLRADQDASAMKRYWAKELGLPLENFMSVSFDKRTIGSPTYPDYKGVCILRCGSVAIQRKLVYLSEQFCERISAETDRNSGAVSSVGRASA